MKPTLGFWSLTALVIGNMIGAGIFVLPANFASYGVLGLGGWFLAALGTLFLAQVFVRLSRRMPHAGGPYTYAHQAFGDTVGFLVAFCYWCGTWVGSAATALAVNGYLSLFYPYLADHGGARAILAIGLVWGLTLVHALGVKEAGLVQMATTILKLIPLVLIPLFGLKAIHLENLSEVRPPPGQSYGAVLNTTALLAFWAFIGLESATVPGDKVQNPEKIIPRATTVGVITTLFVYWFGTFVLLGMFGPERLSTLSAPYATAADILFHHHDWVAFCATCSVLGSLNGWILIGGKIPEIAARDGLFPNIFARVNRFEVPFLALVLSGLAMTALILLSSHQSFSKQYQTVISLASFIYLIPYFLTALAEIVLTPPGPQHRRAKLQAALAAVFAFWIMIGAGQESVFYGSLFFIASFGLFVAGKRSSPSNLSSKSKT